MSVDECDLFGRCVDECIDSWPDAEGVRDCEFLCENMYRCDEEDLIPEEAVR